MIYSAFGCVYVCLEGGRWLVVAKPDFCDYFLGHDFVQFDALEDLVFVPDEPFRPWKREKAQSRKCD